MFPGENEQEQMQYIMEVKGLPPESLLQRSKRAKVFFDEEHRPKLQWNSSGRIIKPNCWTLANAMGTSDDLFVDFVDKCIEWDVADRMTPYDACEHEWIQEGLKEIAKMRWEMESNNT